MHFISARSKSHSLYAKACCELGKDADFLDLKASRVILQIFGVVYIVAISVANELLPKLK